MRYIAKVDRNQREIVQALRDAGASVQLLHQVGKGCPDALIGFRGENYLAEIKTENGELTADELKFFLDWRGQRRIVRTVDDALKMIGAIE